MMSMIHVDTLGWLAHGIPLQQDGLIATDSRNTLCAWQPIAWGKHHCFCAWIMLKPYTRLQVVDSCCKSRPCQAWQGQGQSRTPPNRSKAAARIRFACEAQRAGVAEPHNSYFPRNLQVAQRNLVVG
jgi:hypothetical protein